MRRLQWKPYENKRRLDVAQALSQVMKPAWYANFSTATHAYVVFAGKVFKYAKGDAQARAGAQAYAVSADIPESQIDWGE
jgi:hypothetical protein